MTNGAGSGMKSAIEAAQAAGEINRDVQLDLGLELEDEEEALMPVPVVRGRGRPKGSPNRSSEQLRALLVNKFGDPLLAAASFYAVPTKTLAEHLKCKPEEAAKIQLRAIEVVAPYIHSKRPQEVNVDIEGGMTLTIQDLPFAEGPVIDGGALRVRFGDVQENQGLIDELSQAVGQEELDSLQECEGNQ